MKYKIILLTVIFFIFYSIKAQTIDRRIALGISSGETFYSGDYGGNGFLDFNHSEFAFGYLSLGVSLATYVSPSFDIGIQGSYGEYGYWNSTEYNFIAFKYQTSLFTHYKFNNGYLINKNSNFSPFLSLGFGAAGYHREYVKDHGYKNGGVPRADFKGIDFIIPVGAGLKYQLAKKIAIQYQYLFNFTNRDNHDQHYGPNNINDTKKPGNDAYGEHVFSIIYTFKSYSENKDDRWNVHYDSKENAWKKFGYKKEIDK